MNKSKIRYIHSLLECLSYSNSKIILESIIKNSNRINFDNLNVKGRKKILFIKESNKYIYNYRKKLQFIQFINKIKNYKKDEVTQLELFLFLNNLKCLVSSDWVK